MLKSLESESEKAHLFIYDNSQKRQNIVVKKSAWNDYYYLHDSKNSGLGVAYNTGAKIATEIGLEWIILLDQDTKFQLNFIHELNKSIIKNSEINLFVPSLKLLSGELFSPCIYKYKSGHKSNFLLAGKHSLKKHSPVNSGMVVKLESFNFVNGYIENVKLDFADFQFIEKFRVFNENFYLLDSVAIQDFSNDNKNLESGIFRFKLYLESAKSCKRNTILDDILYFKTVLKHTIGLSLKFKNLSFFKLFYFNYIYIK